MRFVRLLLLVAVAVTIWLVYIREPEKHPELPGKAAPAKSFVAPLPDDLKGRPVEMLWGYPKIELRSGVKKGLLQMRSVRGDGFYALYGTLECRSESPIVVAIEPGTLFQPKAPADPEMVVTAQRIEPMHPGETSGISLRAAAVTMGKAAPQDTSVFELSATPAAGDLAKLLQLPELGSSGVKQFAIWTVTQNPARGDYASIPVYGAPDRKPGQEDFESIRDLLQKAGIGSAPYRALAGTVARPVASAPAPAQAPARGPLIPERDWTNKQGQTLRAELVSASLNASGLFEGIFRRPNGEEFAFPIGRLSEGDVQLVRQTMIEQGLYQPGAKSP